MKTFLRVAILGVLGLGLASSGAFAAPVLWTLQNVTFDDGGAASGSFVFDADLAQFSLVNINATAGSLFGAMVFSFSGETGNPQNLAFTNTNPIVVGTRLFVFSIPTGLTNAGGTVSILPFGGDGVCASLNGNGSCANISSFRSANSSGGSLAGVVVVPEPSALSLLPLGMLAFYLNKRRLA